MKPTKRQPLEPQVAPAPVEPGKLYAGPERNKQLVAMIKARGDELMKERGLPEPEAAQPYKPGATAEYLKGVK